MDYFETLVFNPWNKVPKFWSRYLDDTFCIWGSEPDIHIQFFNYINSLKTSIKFTMEKETDGELPF